MGISPPAPSTLHHLPGGPVPSPCPSLLFPHLLRGGPLRPTLPCPTSAGLSEQAPLHLHFSGHCLANGLLICSIVPCEANSISASQSSLPVDSVIDWRNSCHRPAACSCLRARGSAPPLLLGPPPSAQGGSAPLPPAQGPVASNEK